MDCRNWEPTESEKDGSQGLLQTLSTPVLGWPIELLIWSHVPSMIWLFLRHCDTWRKLIGTLTRRSRCFQIVEQTKWTQRTWWPIIQCFDLNMDGPKVFFDITIGGKNSIGSAGLLIYSWSYCDATVFCTFESLEWYIGYSKDFWKLQVLILRGVDG